MWSSATDARVVSAFERLGFTPVRHSYRMEIDLADATSEPVWPSGISVRTLADGEERLIYEAFMEVWQDTSDPPHDTLRGLEPLADCGRRPSSPRCGFSLSRGDELAGFAVCRKDSQRSGCGTRRAARRSAALAQAGARPRAAAALVPGVPAARLDTRHARCRRVEPDRSDAALRAGRDVCLPGHALPRATGAALGFERVAPPRPLPRLPDTDRGRARAGVPVPLVRPRVRRRPRPRSAGLGRGRRGDGRGGVPRAALPRGGGDRGRHARRADAVARLRASRPARRAGRLLLLARGRDRGALERRGAPGSRLDRCARRPEHAGDVPLGQRLGDAAADGARRRRRPRAATWR